MRLLRFLFSFDGRVSRSAYWLGLVLAFAFFVVVAVVPPLAFNNAVLGLSLLALWPTLAIGAKRCHDRGRSGWYQLVGLIPFVGQITLFIELGFLRGTDGPNRFVAARGVSSGLS
ncbi:DUF805 domain-containing protein [Bradyrhizobium sp. 83012]|uniref:DUF805 domain-containing protein n=1 Tax=Bradyrhizobium aeschynomenes TaxID=2734909 RepID=A0ABX2CPX7_9BRAD|nr:DUF805 domain-containing protein [Bradyrhizobium aeschynomenes]NPU70018.1 DUF805 domain-containing protein [Bradyrhizobium aeschynomenes]